MAASMTEATATSASPNASVITPLLSTASDFTKLETSISPPSVLSAPDYPLPSSRSDTTTILSLPIEILLRVTYFLTLPPQPQPQPHPATASEVPVTATSSQSYTRTLRRFRLTHPTFSYLPLPYLFSHVTLPLSGKHGLLRLHSISSYEYLARHVQHLKIYVKFDLREPDIGFFGQAKAGGSIYWQDLFGVRELPPRRRSQWRSSLQRRASDFSSKLGGKVKGKGRERQGTQSQPKDASRAQSDAMHATRSASVASTDAEDTLQDLQSQFPLYRTRTFPDPTTAPEDFLQTFDDLTALTITRTLFSSSDAHSPTTLPPEKFPSTSKSHHPSSTPSSLSPILRSLASFLTTIFTSLPRLQTLCIDSSTQEEFMENLDRRWALRFAPLQHTWERVSSYLVAGILAGWVKSDCPNVHRLWILGGAVGWEHKLIAEYLMDPVERSELEVEVPLSETDTDARAWWLWSDKVAGIDSLSLKFDVGAYRKNFDAVESTWLSMVRDLVAVTPRLRYLELGKQRRADGCVSDRSGGRSVRLSHIVAVAGKETDDRAETQTTATTRTKTRTTLKLLRLSDLSASSPSDLKACIEALGGQGLERLMLGNIDLYNGTWVTTWNVLRNECTFKLRQFWMMGTKYNDARGWWNVDKRAYQYEAVAVERGGGSGGGMGDDRTGTGERKRLVQLSEYVEGKGEDGGGGFRDLFPLTDDVDVGVGVGVGVSAVTKWVRNGDDSLRFRTR